MTFEDWYETYERDGGELMLYNTIDLESAYQAGYKAAKKQAGNVVLMFACSDHPRCGHDWCRQMQDISDAIN